MNYFCIKIGKGAKYISEALKDGFIGVGWGQISDLKKLGSIDKGFRLDNRSAPKLLQ